VPRSLREGEAPMPFDTSELSLHELNLRQATSQSIILCFVAMLADNSVGIRLPWSS
jgi:hypothetical protein